MARTVKKGNRSSGIDEAILIIACVGAGLWYIDYNYGRSVLYVFLAGIVAMTVLYLVRKLNRSQPKPKATSKSSRQSAAPSVTAGRAKIDHKGVAGSITFVQ